MSILKKWLSPVYRFLGGNIEYRFPFFYEESKPLGKVFLPLVRVSLWLPESETWLDFDFIVDTGSTATIIPSFLSSWLGLELGSLPEIKMAGVEGTGIKSWLAEIKIRIGQEVFSIPCFLVDNPRVPFLLGRAGVLEKFSLRFDNRRREVVFRKD